MYASISLIYTIYIQYISTNDGILHVGVLNFIMQLYMLFTSSLQAYVNTPVGTTLAHAQTSPSGGKTTYVWVKDLTPPTMSLGKLITGRSKKIGGEKYRLQNVSGQIIAYWWWQLKYF